MQELSIEEMASLRGGGGSHEKRDDGKKVKRFDHDHHRKVAKHHPHKRKEHKYS